MRSELNLPYLPYRTEPQCTETWTSTRKKINYQVVRTLVLLICSLTPKQSLAPVQCSWARGHIYFVRLHYSSSHNSFILQALPPQTSKATIHHPHAVLLVDTWVRMYWLSIMPHSDTYTMILKVISSFSPVVTMRRGVLMKLRRNSEVP